jgi:hypothetical protein
VPQEVLSPPLVLNLNTPLARESVGLRLGDDAQPGQPERVRSPSACRRRLLSRVELWKQAFARDTSQLEVPHNALSNSRGCARRRKWIFTRARSMVGRCYVPAVFSAAEQLSDRELRNLP